MLRKHPPTPSDYIAKAVREYEEWVKGDSVTSLKASNEPHNKNTTKGNKVKNQVTLQENVLRVRTLVRKMEKEYQNFSNQETTILKTKTSTQKLKVCIIAWDVAHNPLGRAYILAESLASDYDVEIIGIAHSKYGNSVWEPLRESRVPIKYFKGDSENFINYFRHLQYLAEHIDADIIYVCKPRMPSLIIGILAKLHINRPVILDIDDYELSFFKNRTPAFLDAKEALPEQKDAKCLYGEFWTRYAESLVDKFDAITVSNIELKKKFGGTIIPHLRDENEFNPEKRKDRSAVRQRFGYDDKDMVILFIGTPRWHKGIKDIVEALAKLNNKHYKLCVIGTVSDKKTHDYLEQHRDNSIQMIPNKSFFSLPKYLQVGDLICILQDPSNEISNYQMPSKFSDALAMGIPILAYDVPPLRLLSKKGLLETTTCEELANKIAIIFENLEEYKKKADLNRSIFYRDYSYKSGNEKLTKIFSRTLTNVSPPSKEFIRLKKFFVKNCPPYEGELKDKLIRVDPSNKINRTNKAVSLVMFWKQNDTGIYGRRQDMLVKYLAKNRFINKIIHFDYPISEARLKEWVGQFEENPLSEYGLIYQQTLSRLNGRNNGEKISFYTHCYPGQQGQIDFNKYCNYIENILKENNLSPKESVFWSFPRDLYFPKIANYFKPLCIVADIIDDHRAWPQNKSIKDKYTKNYQQILSMADIAFSNNKTVQASMTEYNDKIYLVPNACELIGEERENWEKPEYLDKLIGPIIGYVGNLDDSRIDVALIKKLALYDRNWQLIFIGSTHCCTELVNLSKRVPNIHLLGVKLYEEALNHINYFDIGIIPHLDNEVTRNMNPLKAYVYASLGVPVLSTDIINVPEIPGLVTTAKTHKEFLLHTASLLDSKKQKTDADDRYKKLFPHSWIQATEHILSLIQKTILDKRHCGS